MTERVLWFAPHAGIWQHAFPEALVVDAVRTAGAEVVYITCGGSFSHCVAMSAVGIKETDSAEAKAKVCTACQRNRTIIRDAFGFRSYDFESALTAEDDASIAGLLSRAPRGDVAGFVVDGIRVGKLALYEYLIREKR